MSNDKATDKQLMLIKDITDELGIEFNGKTKKEASDFISVYIESYRHNRDCILGWGEENGY